jgi:hypothetical protein
VRSRIAALDPAIQRSRCSCGMYFSAAASSENDQGSMNLLSKTDNMWVVAARTAVLSVITGGGKWVEIVAHADPLYQHLVVTAERKFWRCVETGEQPQLFGVEPPRPRLEAIRSSI